MLSTEHFSLLTPYFMFHSAKENENDKEKLNLKLISIFCAIILQVEQNEFTGYKNDVGCEKRYIRISRRKYFTLGACAVED